ncbi:hypothetical protein ACK3TF_002911 [Chlorella vulgaris]
MGPRRPRLLLPQAVDGAPQSAPSAAALAAKTLQAGVTTMLTDNHAPQPAADGFKPPAPRTQPQPAPTQRNEQADSPSGSAGDNVLASLLGYGHDDAAGSPTSPAANAGSHAVRAVSCAPAGSTPGGAPPQPSGSSMDAELASFLSELESSGLLADDEDGKGGEPQLPASDSGIAAAAGEAADAAAAAEQTAAAGQAAAGGASQSGTQAGSGGGGGGASAEQKVLGPVELEGAAHPWFLVLDTGTAKQYYWQPDTNDVAWTLPPTAVVPAATAAAAAAAAAAAVTTAQAGETAPAAAAAAAAAPNSSSDAQQQASSGAAGTAVAAAAAAGPDSAAGPHVETATLPAAFLAMPRPAALEAAERIAAECTEAAGPLLDQMPRVARLAVEAQALSALLLLLARAQEAAVGAADVAAAVKWTDLEATLCMALSALEAQLHALPGRTPLQGQSAAAGAAQAGTGGVGSAADGIEAAGAVLEAGSRSDSGEEEEGELHSSLRQPQVQQQQAQPQPQPDADLPPPLPADCEQSEAAAGVGPPFPPPDAVHTQRGALETHAAPLPHSPPASLPPLPDEQPKKRRGPAAPPGVGKKARSGAGGAAPVAAAAPLAGGSGAGHSKMGRGAASLINKWQKVAQEVAAQEEEEAAEEERLDDPLARAAASSAQRRRGAEEWRLQQLRSGAADGNSNFQPVLGDWRHRVQQQAEPQAAQAPVETAATAADEAAEGEEGGAGDGAGVMPDLDLLSAGLPPGWQAMWDDAHAKVYYGNLDTSLPLTALQPWLLGAAPSTPRMA